MKIHVYDVNKPRYVPGTLTEDSAARNGSVMSNNQMIANLNADTRNSCMLNMRRIHVVDVKHTERKHIIVLVKIIEIKFLKLVLKTFGFFKF